MKRLAIITLSLLFILPSGFSFADVTKTACTSSFGKTEKQAKEELLVIAKRSAIGELFGEYIKSLSVVKDFSLQSDNIKSQSVGFVRVKGNPIYYQGKNLGEICVKINAYAKSEDFDKFKPKKLFKEVCIREGSIETIKKRAEEKAKLEALTDYDQSLKKYPTEQILPLLHEIKFLEEGFVKSIYCVKVSGTVYPIEIAELTTERFEPVIAKKEKEIEVIRPEKPGPIKPEEKPYVALQKVEANNFTFELKKCKRSGTNVTCDLLIINNNDEDIRVYIIGSHAAYGYSRIIDDLGNEYKANLAQIGKIKKRSRVSTTFVQGVPTKTVLYFEGVSSKPKKLSLLEVECSIGDSIIHRQNKNFRAQFRNIPLLK